MLKPDDDLITRLENWKRWAKSSQKPPVSCQSLENRYRSPQHWYAPEPKIFIDIIDANKIEKCIIKLPRPQLNIIVYAYVKPGYHFDAFCSKNRIRGNKHLSKSEQFKLELYRAETMLKNILYKGIARSQFVEYKETYNLIPERIAAV